MKVVALLLLVVIVAAHAAPYSNLATKTCPTEVCDEYNRCFLFCKECRSAPAECNLLAPSCAKCEGSDSDLVVA